MQTREPLCHETKPHKTGRNHTMPGGVPITYLADKACFFHASPSPQAKGPVCLDPDYGGQWVVAADLDADGRVDFVSCENHNVGDVHYTSTAVAHRLDGSVLWRWGDPDVGRKEWHHDVACQIHDWDGDSRPEVILATKGALVELDGRTGAERRRIPIAEDATDCIVFADLPGGAALPMSSSRTAIMTSTHTINKASCSGTSAIREAPRPPTSRARSIWTATAKTRSPPAMPCLMVTVHCDGGSARSRSTRTAAISTVSASSPNILAPKSSWISIISLSVRPLCC